MRHRFTFPICGLFNRSIPLFFLLLCCGLPVVGQVRIMDLGQAGRCDYFGQEHNRYLTLFEGFSSNAFAVGLIEQMMLESGLSPHIEVQQADVYSAAAFSAGKKRYIVYSPGFLFHINRLSRTRWSAISILAHELGHHLNGHTWDEVGSLPERELEADTYSGFVLARMGATLEEAQAALRLLGHDWESSTHPGKARRLQAIERGWKRGRARK